VGDGGRWWGGNDKVMAVVGSCVGLRKPGLWVLGQKPETSPLGLGLGHGVGNGSGGRWREVVGWWCRRGGCGGVYVHSSTRGGRAGAQKLEIRALMARFWSASGLQKVERGSVVSQDPRLWYPRWWLVRSEMVWQEGVVLLTLGPASLPVSPSLPHPFPSFSLSSYFPPRDPWMGWVQSDGPRVQWWLSGRQRDAPCHVWWSFKLRRFSIAIAI